MIIKKKKINKYFLVPISLIFLFLIYLLINSPGFKGDLAQSLRIILKQPVLLKAKKIHDNKILDYPVKILYGIENRLFNSPNLDTLNIDIQFEELEKLKKDREKALKIRHLNNPQKINISITHGNKKFRATARLKGDQPAHWSNIKQWSLRIKLKKNKTLFKMNEFSLTIPQERDYPNIFVFSKILKENNILTPTHKLVNVTMNGNDWGIMTLEEQFHDSFYAFNRLKEAPILKITNENDFTISSIISAPEGIYSNEKVSNVDDIIKWQGKLETKIYNKEKILNKTNIPNKNTNETLLSIFKTLQEVIIKKEENYLNKINQYIDVRAFARASALTAFWGDAHSNISFNSRYYINPYNLKIRPILTDSVLGKVDKNFFHSHNLFYKNLFNLDSFQKEYFLTLRKIKKKFSKIEDEYKSFCKEYGKNCFNKNDINTLRANLNYLTSIDKKIFNIPKFSKKLTFDTKNKQNINKKKIHIRAYNNGDVLIDNLTSEILKIDNVTLKFSESCKNDCNKPNIKIPIYSELMPSTFDTITSKVIKINIPDNLYKFIEINYFDEEKRLISITEKIEKFFFQKKYLFNNNNFVLNDFINITNKNYVISKGDYNVNLPIIVPQGYNLIIENGTNLKMAKDTYIMIKDGLLKLEGEINSPITITSKFADDYWKGIYVNKNSINDSYSILKHTKISNFTYFDNEFIQLTGGLNFINGNIKLFNSSIENSNAEDAINLVQSNFLISELYIKNSKSDGIDVDFGMGKILKSNFNDIYGDAIDLSGSEVFIDKIKISNIGDKAISVGENTDLKISNSNISNSRIGIASKDSSNVVGSKINVSNCGLYDFAVYKKKNYFSGASLIVQSNSTCNKSLVQMGSKLFINNKQIIEKKFNTKKLYDGTL